MDNDWVIEKILRKLRGEDQPQPQLPAPGPPEGWREPETVRDEEDRGVTIIPMF